MLKGNVGAVEELIKSGAYVSVNGKVCLRLIVYDSWQEACNCNTALLTNEFQFNNYFYISQI